MARRRLRTVTRRTRGRNLADEASHQKLTQSPPRVHLDVTACYFRHLSLNALQSICGHADRSDSNRAQMRFNYKENPLMQLRGSKQAVVAGGAVLAALALAACSSSSSSSSSSSAPGATGTSTATSNGS